MGIYSQPINEKYLITEKDIYYNKDKFDSGKINLCFITGLSGSGKSTMASNLSNSNVEVYELDDVILISAFSDDNLKEYGDLIYSFFINDSYGKHFRMPYKCKDDEWYQENNFKDTNDYFNKLIKSFIDFSIKYTNRNKSTKYIIEGIELFLFIDPSKLKNHAVYIKGTSTIKSWFRALKRNINNASDNHSTKKEEIKNSISSISSYIQFEKMVNNYRKYYSNLINNY